MDDLKRKCILLKVKIIVLFWEYYCIKNNKMKV
jgi:hypothetical protein